MAAVAETSICFGNLPELQLHVHAHSSRGRNHDILLHESFEAGGGDFDPVHSGHKVRHIVFASGRGNDSGSGVGVAMDDHQLGSRYRGAGGIRYDSGDVAAFSLRKQRRKQLSSDRARVPVILMEDLLLLALCISESARMVNTSQCPKLTCRTGPAQQTREQTPRRESMV